MDGAVRLRARRTRIEASAAAKAERYKEMHRADIGRLLHSLSAYDKTHSIHICFSGWREVTLENKAIIELAEKEIAHDHTISTAVLQMSVTEDAAVLSLVYTVLELKALKRGISPTGLSPIALIPAVLVPIAPSISLVSH